MSGCYVECPSCGRLPSECQCERERCEKLVKALNCKHGRLARSCEICDLEQERDKAVHEMVEWRKAVQRLTPGGSEFMDPRSVEEWAVQKFRETGDAKLAKVKSEQERDALAAKLVRADEDRQAANTEVGRLQDEREVLLRAARQYAQEGLDAGARIERLEQEREDY